MAETYTIDCCQYCNWSEKIFQQMREGGVDAVHVTICYHEDFRETVEEIVDWNRRFERYGELIVLARTRIRHRARPRRGTHRHLLRPAELPRPSRTTSGSSRSCIRSACASCS